MANCNFLSSDYELPCRDQMGGIETVFVGQWSGNTSYTLDSNDVISGVTNGPTMYEFEQRRETADFTETGNYGDNGTRFFEQAVSIALEKMDADLRNKLRLLGESKVLVAVRDANDNTWLIGKDRGGWITESEGGSGTAAGDRNGASITITGRERYPAYLLNDSAESDLGIS